MAAAGEENAQERRRAAPRLKGLWTQVHSTTTMKFIYPLNTLGIIYLSLLPLLLPEVSGPSSLVDTSTAVSSLSSLHTHIHTGSGDMAAGDRRVGLKTGEWKNPGSKGRGVGQWAGLTT